MKKIQAKSQVEPWVERANIRQCFDTPGLQFHLYEYEKGECIITPSQSLDVLLFLVEGTVRIYGIREDGAMSPVNQQDAPIVLGDIEFCCPGNPCLFAEAVTRAVCVTLPVQPYREQLHRDIRFLHTLMQSYIDKLQRFSFVDAQAATIEERVLLYMRDICPDHEIKGIEAAVLQLRCSRRQLQRVLHKLCQNGLVEKMAKGRYRLLEG